MKPRHMADSRLRRAWQETSRQLSRQRPNWRKTAKNLVSSLAANAPFHRRRPRDCYVVDPSLAAGAPGVPAGRTGETPVPPPAVIWRSDISYFFPTAITTNEFGKGIGRPRGFSGLGFGAGPRSAVTVSICPVEASNVIVRAPFFVGTFSISAYFPSRWPTKLILPSPFEVTASLDRGSTANTSLPSPVGTVAISLPVFASTIAICLLPQAAKMCPSCRSISKPLGSSHPAIGHSAITLLALESITAIKLLSSMLT